jgi:hypothetical protein
MSVLTSQLELLQKLSQKYKPLCGSKLCVNIDRPCCTLNLNSLQFLTVQLNGKVDKIISEHAVSLLTMFSDVINVDEMPKLLFATLDIPNLLISYKDGGYILNKEHPRYISKLDELVEKNLPFGSMAMLLNSY